MMNTNEQLRKALDEIAELIIGWRVASKIRGEQYQPLRDICDTALSAPPRNCDVGTAEEQTLRYHDYCWIKSNGGMSCGKCPLNKCKGLCYFEWGQLPYKDKE